MQRYLEEAQWKLAEGSPVLGSLGMLMTHVTLLALYPAPEMLGGSASANVLHVTAASLAPLPETVTSDHAQLCT